MGDGMGGEVDGGNVFGDIRGDVGNDGDAGADGDVDDYDDNSEDDNTSDNGNTSADHRPKRYKKNLFRETLEDYSGRNQSFWMGKDSEDESEFENRFYGAKLKQYKGYAAYMDRADEPLVDSLKAIDLQLDFLRSHIGSRQSTSGSIRDIETLELTMIESSDSEPEGPPNCFHSDPVEQAKDSSHSEDDDEVDATMLLKWYVSIFQSLHLLMPNL